MKLMVLTFVRTGELRGALWSEFEQLDGDAPLWRIPAARMKIREEHLVPLAPQAVAVLQELRPLCGNSSYLFPGKGDEGVMSNNTMLYALYRMGFHGRATVHGFRGVASTLLNEAGLPPTGSSDSLPTTSGTRCAAHIIRPSISPIDAV